MTTQMMMPNMASMTSALSSNGLLDQLGTHLTQLNGMNDLLKTLQPSGEDAASPVIASKLSGAELEMLAAEENNSEQQGRKDGKRGAGLYFVDARPPYQREKALKQGYVLVVEDYLKQQFERERVNTRSMSPIRVVFLCKDGLTSATAATNQLRYHPSLQAFYASLSEEEVKMFFRKSATFKTYCRHGEPIL